MWGSLERSEASRKIDQKCAPVGCGSGESQCSHKLTHRAFARNTINKNQCDNFKNSLMIQPDAKFMQKKR